MKYFRKRVLEDLKAEEEQQMQPGADDLAGLEEGAPMDPMGMGMQPMAISGIRQVTASSKFSQKKLDEELKRDLLEDYAMSACKAIEKIHDSCVYKVDEDDILIFDLKLPSGSLASIYPLHSGRFYQRYWKPIVDEIGNFHIDSCDTTFASGSSLPDLPAGSCDHNLEGWNTADNDYKKVCLKFHNDGTWFFDEALGEIKTANVSRYTEQDYMNAIVKANDPTLESIHGRTGYVIQVIPMIDHIEVDVDFGRGLDVVRLTERQIEIVPA
jgi:hypothetical protein